MRYIYNVLKINLLLLFLLVGAVGFSQSSDFFVQHVEDDVARAGATNATPFTAVSSLNSAFAIANNNRKTHAGRSDLNDNNLDGDDMSGARVLTGLGELSYYREGSSLNTNMRFNSSVWEYVGPAGGCNEMIVRGRYAVSLNGTTNSLTVNISSDGVVGVEKCIPFITGIINNSAVDDADSSTAIAYLESSSSLRVQKGSNANNVTVYVTLVEFTGSNWTVLHGDSGNTGADSGTITLRDGADGTGAASNVSSWNEALIFSHFRADNNANGVDDAISDLWPVTDPGNNNQRVDWTFNTQHESAQNTNRHFVHVLNNPYLSVNRIQDNGNSAGETTLPVTISNVNEALVVGSSSSSGGGTAYGRGWRNYYLKSTTEVAHWAHRSGNAISHEIQVADLSALTSQAINVTDSASNVISDASVNSSSIANDTEFGNIEVNSSIVKTYTIENNGNCDLTISSIISDNSYFVVSGAPSSISAGGSDTFMVTYTPLAVGETSAEITINNNDSNTDEQEYTFTLRGTGEYCSSNGNNTDDEYISNVLLNTINNTSGVWSTSLGYSDFTSISTDLLLNSTHTITITPTWTGTIYDEGYAVWIDYNQDGVFDTSEQVWTEPATQATPVSGSFTVPSSAILGATRMRVSMKYDEIPANSCESFTWGEVEDYTINIIDSDPYCTPINIGSYNNYYISDVSLGTLSNTTTGTTGSYNNYSATFTPVDVTAGGSLDGTISVDINDYNRNSNDLNVWIDLNQDLDFDDPNEHYIVTVTDPTNPGTGIKTVTVSVSIPIPSVSASVLAGNTRMRIGFIHDDGDAYSYCDYDYNAGEVEDYTINIIDACLAISNNSFDLTTGIFGTISTTAPENGNATLTAPAGENFVYVGFASYGTPTGTDPNFSIGSCHATTSQSVAEGYLIGNTTATIPATNAVFGDPCYGTYKYLYVQASYAAPICAGTSPGILTGRIPSGGDGTYTYLWQSSTTSATSGFVDAVGTNNAKDYTPGALTQTTWYRRIVTSCTATSTSATVKIEVISTNTWTGTVSSDWNNAANWSCGEVPIITTNVLIPSSVSNYPEIYSADAAGLSNDIEIESGATLTVFDNSMETDGTLLLNGDIILDGEGQLLQTTGSILDAASTGTIERDQQGTANTYSYNYWGSPVGGSYALEDVLYDGVNPVNFVGGHNGSLGTPVNIANRWIYTYVGSGAYIDWSFVGSTGTINAGEGFSMKGPNPTAIATDEQNYTFKGLPNNGIISLPVSVAGEYLVANPYPSAISVLDFLTDNRPAALGGTDALSSSYVIFWEQFSPTSHNLAEYQGGYWIVNGSGVLQDAESNRPGGIGSGGVSSKTPGIYVPVAQGFFVEVSGTGNIEFNNGQRVFIPEDGSGDSVFMKANTSKSKVANKTKGSEDLRPKFRLGFEAPQVAHRQLLLTIDENTTDGVDWAYDGEIIGVVADDLYWVINDEKYVIQALPDANIEREIPLGIVMSETGLASIQIDALENVDANTELYIKDALVGKTYKINNAPFEIELEAGEYKDRFSLVFKPNKTLDIKDEILENGLYVYVNNNAEELGIRNTTNSELLEVKLYNSLGQEFNTWTKNLEDTLVVLPVNNIATGMYIVQIKTSTGNISKKVIIE